MTGRHLAAVNANLAHAAGLRQLHADPRKPQIDVDIAKQIVAGAGAFETATRSWLAILPRKAAIEAAQQHLIGLQRALSELAALQK